MKRVASSGRSFGTHTPLRATAVVATRPIPSTPPPLPSPSLPSSSHARHASRPPAPPKVPEPDPKVSPQQLLETPVSSAEEVPSPSSSSSSGGLPKPTEGSHPPALLADKKSKKRESPVIPLTDLPSFLVPFLPTGAALSVKSAADGPFSLFESASLASAPAVLKLPPRPLQRDVRALSLLQGLLPLSSWRHHPLLFQQYLAVPSELLTAHVHRKVGLALAQGPNGLDAFQRLDAVVRRMKADRVEVPHRCAERLLYIALGKKSVERGMKNPVSVGRMRERSQADADRLQETWDMLYKDQLPSAIPFERPADFRAVTELKERSLADTTPASSPDSPNFRSPHSAMPAPSIKPTRGAFDNLMRLPHSAQTFNHILSLSPLSSASHLPSILSHLHRSYATVPAHLPDILNDPELELSTRAINEILFAFTSDENIHLNVPFEAYVAFRRHAAGLPWRRAYVSRAAQGMYHNNDDALVSFANPILDSMNYDFPPSAAPDRRTYTIMLRACTYRGDLNLALSVFRDMINPNGMSLRLPGSAPGRAGRPPNELRTYRPAVEDYTQFFTGFLNFGEVSTVSDEARDYWTAHPEAYQRAGGGELGELFEDLDTRERLLKTWEAGMGADAEEMEDPYVPGFGGEMPAAKQYAVNSATEAKRWTLQTLTIIFRSFLALQPRASHDQPHRPLPSFLPPLPPWLPRNSVTAPSGRRIHHLLRALHKCSSGHPRVIQSAWSAVEDKFGKGNAEGWVGWKVTPELRRYLGQMGVRPRDWDKNVRGGYEPTD